jgi:hypothetical protein
MIRPLEHQFEPEKVQKIRELEKSFQSLRSQFKVEAARYFVSEIVRCLEAGVLLAALEVATSLLELFVLALLIAARREDHVFQHSVPSSQIFPPSPEDQIEREITDVKRLSFNSMVDEWAERRSIGQSDADAIKDFYKTVRIPIHHGLTRRFICPSPDIDMQDDFLAGLFLAGLGRRARLHKFEEVIEDGSLRHLSSIVDFIGRYSDLV